MSQATENCEQPVGESQVTSSEQMVIAIQYSCSKPRNEVVLGGPIRVRKLSGSVDTALALPNASIVLYVIKLALRGTNVSVLPMLGPIVYIK